MHVSPATTSTRQRFAPLAGVLAALVATCLSACQSPQPAAPAAPRARAEQPDRSDAIAAELIAMAREDQAARMRLIEITQEHGGFVAPWSPEAREIREAQQVDEKNTARLKDIVDEIGWPTVSKVGKQASDAAWLIAQHAVHDLEFMERVRQLMEPHVGTGEVEDQHYALLTDRLLDHAGKPQRYGSQFTWLEIDGIRHFGPMPIEDPERVDERRAEVGLPPLDEYEHQLRQAYGVPDDTPAIPRTMTRQEYDRLRKQTHAP
jgi:hypothetical protein